MSVFRIDTDTLILSDQQARDTMYRVLSFFESATGIEISESKRQEVFNIVDQLIERETTSPGEYSFFYFEVADTVFSRLFPLLSGVNVPEGVSINVERRELIDRFGSEFVDYVFNVDEQPIEPQEDPPGQIIQPPRVPEENPFPDRSGQPPETLPREPTDPREPIKLPPVNNLPSPPEETLPRQPRPTPDGQNKLPELVIPDVRIPSFPRFPQPGQPEEEPEEEDQTEDQEDQEEEPEEEDQEDQTEDQEQTPVDLSGIEQVLERIREETETQGQENRLAAGSVIRSVNQTIEEVAEADRVMQQGITDAISEQTDQAEEDTKSLVGAIGNAFEELIGDTESGINAIVNGISETVESITDLSEELIFFLGNGFDAVFNELKTIWEKEGWNTFLGYASKLETLSGLHQAFTEDVKDKTDRWENNFSSLFFPDMEDFMSIVCMVVNFFKNISENCNIKTGGK